MANGVDPLQQFIQNHMGFQQFMEGQRQFGMQVALQQREMENAEIQQFAALAPFIEQPEQRASLAEYFASRNPQMAETFGALASTIPISEQVYRSRLIGQGYQNLDPTEVASMGISGMSRGQAAVSGATAGRSAEDLQTGMRIGEGQELSAGQTQQNEQFIRSFFEGQRQFGIEADQRNRQLGQTDRQLGIAEFEAAQRGELGRLSTMFGAGFGGHVLRGEHSQQLREVENELQIQGLSPERRAALQTRRSELQNAIRQMDNWIAAQMAPRGGAGGAGGAGGMDLNQIIQATETALTQVNEASSPGEREVAIQNFNAMRALLGQAGIQGSMLQQEQGSLLNPLNWWDRMLGRPGSAVAIPYNPALGTPPFMPPQP